MPGRSPALLRNSGPRWARNGPPPSAEYAFLVGADTRATTAMVVTTQEIEVIRSMAERIFHSWKLSSLQRNYWDGRLDRA